LVTLVGFIAYENTPVPESPQSGRSYAAILDEHTTSTSYIVHPYVGYVIDYKDGYSNKYGFLGPDPIAHRSPDKVIVGIFGGSVAGEYYGIEKDELTKALQALPAFKNKKIEVYITALAGYKQPQQFMALNYILTLGGQFDIVINIDGFNEVVLPYVENLPNQISGFFPRSWNFFSRQTLGLDSMLVSASIEQHKINIAKLQSFFSSPFLTFLGPIRDYFLSEESYQMREDEEKLAALLNSEPKEYRTTGPGNTATDTEGFGKNMVGMWKESSIQMSKLASANGALYLHFLQPNQYVAGSKPLSEKEKRIAFNNNQPYKKAVELFYPELIKEGSDLVKAGVNFTDLTSIFKNNADTFYIDDCCHFNQAGNSILNQKIVQTIAEKYVQPISISR